MQNRHHSSSLAGPRWEEFSLAPKPAAREASFHASLRDCEVNYISQLQTQPQKPVSLPSREIEPTISAPVASTPVAPVPVPPVPVARRRSWLWARSKKTLPSGKQLQVVKSLALESNTPSHAQIIQPQTTGSRIFAHVRSWLHKKYSMTSTKRLRVTEMVPLGEKRFLAVVSVEGREFLIGGGASGVSVVTQLQGALENVGVPATDFALQGKSA